jgi:Ran-binding protein 9/10
VRGLNLNNLPGWDVGSVGYHGDDGRLWNSDTKMMTYIIRDKFGTGDTVGCGITLNRR